MKVILTERVPTLGNVGEILNVSAGYGRNFLIPNRFAVLADGANQKQVEDHKRRLAKKIQDQKDVALALKKRIDGTTLELVKKVGGNGKLFGSVTNTDLAKELVARDIDVERRLIVIDNPIKSLGTFTVRVKLFTEVEASFKVKVTMDALQAKELKEKQLAAEKRAAEKKARKESGEDTEEESSEKSVDEEVTTQE